MTRKTSTQPAKSTAADPEWPHPASTLAHKLSANGSFPMVVAAEHMLDSMAQVQAELTRFGAQRVHRAMSAQEEMLGCRNLGEMRHVQAEYINGMMGDYVREWLRIMQYGMSITGGHDIEPVREPAGQADAKSVTV